MIDFPKIIHLSQFTPIINIQYFQSIFNLITQYCLKVFYQLLDQIVIKNNHPKHVLFFNEILLGYFELETDME